MKLFVFFLYIRGGSFFSGEMECLAWTRRKTEERRVDKAICQGGPKERQTAPIEILNSSAFFFKPLNLAERNSRLALPKPRHSYRVLLY